MTSLASGEVGVIEVERIALRKLRLLPLVVGGKGANEFVVVERTWQIGLVASCAKLRRMQKVVHHRFRMTLGILENHIERNHAGNALSLLVHDHRGYAHLDAGISVGRVQTHNGMTRRTSQTVGVETGAIHIRVLGQRATQDTDGIVAAIAVAGKGNPTRLIANQEVDAGAIERSSKGVGVKRLARLAVGFLMACAAILRSGEGAGLQKSISLNLDVTWSEGIIFTVMEVIAWSHLRIVGFALFFHTLLGFCIPIRKRLELSGGVLGMRNPIVRWCIR